MRLLPVFIIFLALVGCGAERHEKAFRISDPSDFEDGAAREKELKWLLENKDIYEGMSEHELIAKIGDGGNPGNKNNNGDTSYHEYSLGPGRRFHVWCKNGKVVEMQRGAEEEGGK